MSWRLWRRELAASNKVHPRITAGAAVHDASAIVPWRCVVRDMAAGVHRGGSTVAAAAGLLVRLVLLLMLHASAVSGSVVLYIQARGA